MRILLSILVFLIPLLADKYISFHQFPDENGKRSFYDQIVDNQSNRINIFANLPYHGEAISCRNGRKCYETKDPRLKDWYGTRWMRYRIYISKNIKNFSFRFGSIANTTFVALYYFIPDNSAIHNIDFRNYKLTKIGEWDLYKDFHTEDARNRYFFQGYHLLYAEAYNSSGKISFNNVNKYNTNGGWFYINLAQACTVTDCWFDDGKSGNRPDAKPYLAFTLSFKDKLPKIINEFKDIKFDFQKDPVENFSILHEIHRTLSGTTIKNIYGNHEGSYLFDPDQPDLTIKNILNKNTLQYDVTLEAGNAPIKGITVEQNSNVTLSFKIDDCLQITQTAKNSNRGEYFYSEDGKHWAKDFNESTHYIKYTIASVDDSGIVLYPHDKLVLNVQNRITDCADQIKSDIEALLNLKDQNMILKKESIVSYKETESSSSATIFSTTTTTTNSSTTTDANNDAKQCEESGGIWLDTFCQRPSSSQSSFQASRSSSSSVSSISSLYTSNNANNANNDARQCEESGGIWLDTFCQRPSSSQSSFQASRSSSSSVSSISSLYTSNNANNANNDVKQCEESGGIWLDTFCQYPSSSSKSVSSSITASSSSSQGEDYRISKILQKLAGKSFEVKGYFIHYDKNDTFGWAYKSRGNIFAKLDGMDPSTGHLKWTLLQNYFTSVQYDDNSEKIVVGDIITLDSKSHKISRVLQKLAGKSFEVKGYFIHYDKNDTFGWAYKSRGNIFAKLDGMDPSTGHLKWTLLQNYFTSVQYDDNSEKIVVGDIIVTDMSE